MNQACKAILMLICSATIAMPDCSAQSIKVRPNSPLKQLIEDYLPDDYAPGEDPLAAPDMKPHGDEAVQLGWKYFKKKDFETALKRFFMAIRMNRNDAHGYFGVAYVCSVQNNLDDAIVFYREALKYEKHYSPIYANLGLALLLKDHHSKEGLLMIDQALKVDPKNAQAYFTKANYYAEQGDWKNCGKNARQAIRYGKKIPSELISRWRRHGVSGL